MSTLYFFVLFFPRVFEKKKKKRSNCNYSLWFTFSFVYFESIPYDLLIKVKQLLQNIFCPRQLKLKTSYSQMLLMAEFECVFYCGLYSQNKFISKAFFICQCTCLGIETTPLIGPERNLAQSYVLCKPI